MTFRQSSPSSLRFMHLSSQSTFPLRNRPHCYFLNCCFLTGAVPGVQSSQQRCPHRLVTAKRLLSPSRVLKHFPPASSNRSRLIILRFYHLPSPGTPIALFSPSKIPIITTNEPSASAEKTPLTSSAALASFHPAPSPFL